MAEEAMVRLDRAVKERDWQAAVHAVGRFRSAFEYGYMRESTAAGLVTMTQQQRLNEIRHQLRLLTQSALVVDRAAETRNSQLLAEYNHRMQQAYAQLKALVGDWPESPTTQPASQPAATQ
jgi:hypothetical protein